jgi:hypothetical protein
VVRDGDVNPVAVRQFIGKRSPTLFDGRRRNIGHVLDDESAKCEVSGAHAASPVGGVLHVPTAGTTPRVGAAIVATAGSDASWVAEVVTSVTTGACGGSWTSWIWSPSTVKSLTMVS